MNDMNNTTRNNARSGSFGRKVSSSHTRTNRPTAPVKRGSNYSSSRNLTALSTNRPSSKGRQDNEALDFSEHENDSMASFLQFCATCEKQIITPGNSILYCSEQCRRRDSAKSISQYSPPLSPYTASSDDHSYNIIVPRRSPTILRPISTTFSELSLYELTHDEKHGSEDEIDESTFGMPTQSSRPYLKRTSTSEDSTNIPSLIHTPSSSYGTVASERPLPKKHSCAKCARKSIDLVTPILAAPSALSNALDHTERRGSAPVSHSGRAMTAEQIRKARGSQPSNVYRA